MTKESLAATQQEDRRLTRSYVESRTLDIQLLNGTRGPKSVDNSFCILNSDDCRADKLASHKLGLARDPSVTLVIFTQETVAFETSCLRMNPSDDRLTIYVEHSGISCLDVIE